MRKKEVLLPFPKYFPFFKNGKGKLGRFAKSPTEKLTKEEKKAKAELFQPVMGSWTKRWLAERERERKIENELRKKPREVKIFTHKIEEEGKEKRKYIINPPFLHIEDPEVRRRYPKRAKEILKKQTEEYLQRFKDFPEHVRKDLKKAYDPLLKGEIMREKPSKLIYTELWKKAKLPPIEPYPFPQIEPFEEMIPKKTLPIYSLQSTMNPEVWIGDGKEAKLKRKIKNQIMDAIRKHLESNNIDRKETKRIILTGSSAAYRWRKDGDIDVHLEGNWKEKEYPNWSKLYKLKNSKLKIEVSITEKQDPEQAEGIYNIITNKWEKIPEKFRGEANWDIIIEEAISWARKIDLDLGELKRDILEYLMYQEKGQSDVAREMILARKSDEIKADLDNLVITWNSLSELRQKSLSEDEPDYLFSRSESESRMLRSGNLVFKLLQKFDYLNMLKRIKILVKELKNETDFKIIAQRFKNFLKQQRWIE